MFEQLQSSFKEWMDDDMNNKYYLPFEILLGTNARIEYIDEIEFEDIDDLRIQEEVITAGIDDCINNRNDQRAAPRVIKRIDCDCGGHYIDTKAAQKAHEKTKKHKNYLVRLSVKELAEAAAEAAATDAAAAEVLRMVEEEGYEYFESISELGSESESEYLPEHESQTTSDDE